MSARRRRWMALGTAMIFGGALLTSSCQRIGSLDSIELVSDEDGAPAQALNQPTVADLAGALDSLERGIESDGSIVAEQPSVWGQARLTMYRQEFETTMAKQLNNFQSTLNGSLSRSDQAYAADAMALSYAAAAAASNPSSNSTLCGLLPSFAPASSSSSSASAAGGTPVVATTGTTPAPTATTSTSPFSYDPSTTAFNAFSTLPRTQVNMLTPLPFVGSNGTAIGGISLEPTVFLDEMARYINHLHELRRMSDGDDTADAPGYSLNLLRVPVSVLPGKRTEQRYGGEITLSIKPHLNPELLPMTFHNLVVNDLLDEIGVPLTHVLNDQDWDKAMQNLWKEISDLPPDPMKKKTKFQLFVAAVESMLTVTKECSETPPPTYGAYLNYHSGKTLNTAFKRVENFLAVRSSSRLRTGQEAFPPSQIVDIYGAHDFAEIVCAAWCTFWSDVPNKDVVHYPDVQSFLQQELDASYNLLKLNEAVENLWPICNEALVSDIHGRKLCEIGTVRCGFDQAALALSERKAQKPELTSALAWTILVDSALLNQRLCEDMVQAPAARGGNFNLPPRGTWLPYFLPVPDDATREAFNEYVRCRWPIHVFALDPEDDNQNVADSYSMRREMQLAVSLSFASGNLSANNLFQFARRLETDMETIALNKTMVGFSHGTDVFGWRFYPRYQSPDTESNCKAFLELLCGGPNRRQLLRQRQLEPGMRECVAIVLMPSFVPYADIDASSNWFALDNPRRKLMNSKKAIRLGEQVKMIENCSQFVGHTECYRDGDLERLLSRVKQLESRLPLQSMSVQVPYENTLGGFSMFNTGVTDLAPEVLGWYGAPAINLDAPTTIFLIGNHFSVHQTRVLIGGQEITTPELLSRQVMKVTIPQYAMALIEANGLVAGGYQEPANPFGHMKVAECYDPDPPGCPSPAKTGQDQQSDEDESCHQTSAFELADEPPPGPKANKAILPRKPAYFTPQPSPSASPGAPASPSGPQAPPAAPSMHIFDSLHTTPGETETYPNPDDTSGHVVVSPADPTCQLVTNDAKTWIQTLSHQETDEGRAMIFPNCAITLHDPGVSNRALPPGTLSLIAKTGTLILGKLNGLTFISGTNGSSSMAVRGNLADLQAALNGLMYVPQSKSAGGAKDDVMTIILVGSGGTQSTVNVAITIHPKEKDYYYVDVQMATPYGATSHLLVPAAHLTKTGSGTTGGATASASASSTVLDVSTASSQSAKVSLPQWTTPQLTLGYVDKGIGIVACDPPSFTPNALTVNLGTNYQTPPDNTVNLAFSLDAPANGTLPAQPITLVAGTAGTPGVNWDATNHVLTIAGQDLVNMTNNLMGVIQYQFGASRPAAPPLTHFTLETTVTDFSNSTGFKLTNKLTVNLVQAPRLRSVAPVQIGQ